MHVIRTQFGVFRNCHLFASYVMFMSQNFMWKGSTYSCLHPYSKYSNKISVKYKFSQRFCFFRNYYWFLKIFLTHFSEENFSLTHFKRWMVESKTSNHYYWRPPAFDFCLNSYVNVRSLYWFCIDCIGLCFLYGSLISFDEEAIWNMICDLCEWLLM